MNEDNALAAWEVAAYLNKWKVVSIADMAREVKVTHDDALDLIAILEQRGPGERLRGIQIGVEIYVRLTAEEEDVIKGYMRASDQGTDGLKEFVSENIDHGYRPEYVEHLGKMRAAWGREGSGHVRQGPYYEALPEAPPGPTADTAASWACGREGVEHVRPGQHQRPAPEAPPAPTQDQDLQWQRTCRQHARLAARAVRPGRQPQTDEIPDSH